MTTKHTLWQALAVFGFMLVFLCVRGVSIQHTASYGAGPHQHNGKICTLSLVAHEEEDAVLLPSDPPIVDLRLRTLTVFSYGQYLSPALNSWQSVEATARSPPTV